MDNFKPTGGICIPKLCQEGFFHRFENIFLDLNNFIKIYGLAGVFSDKYTPIEVSTVTAFRKLIADRI